MGIDTFKSYKIRNSITDNIESIKRSSPYKNVSLEPLLLPNSVSVKFQSDKWNS